MVLGQTDTMALVLGGFMAWPRDNRFLFGNWFLLWVVIALLGWKTFGFALQG